MRRNPLPYLVFFIGLIYFFQLSKYVYVGDSPDMLAAAALFGVPHPPGYPLYTFISGLLTKLPFFTIPWRVSLMSYIPHILTLIYVYKIVFTITKKQLPAVFSVLMLAGMNLFILYSITPEVFALLDFFVSITLYYMILFIQTRHLKNLYIAVFFYGLALSHHHMILFLLPIYLYSIYLIISKSSKMKLSVKLILGLFVVGLIPYIYIPIAAHGTAMVNWDKADTIHHFFRLITRADYGSFQSGSVFGSAFLDRIINIKLFLYYFQKSFSWIGIILFIGGFIFLYKTNRRLFYLFLFSILSIGPIFIFYASFPVINNFMMGTYERFLLPSFVISSIVIGIGFAYCLSLIQKLSVFGNLQKKLLYFNILCLTIFIVPIGLFYKNYRNYVGLGNDFTANNLAHDVLDITHNKAILIVNTDTVIFPTVYERYVNKYNSHIILLESVFLTDDWYIDVVKKNFPELKFPDTRGRTFFNEFVRLNDTYEIYTNAVNILYKSDYVYIPYGLLYQIVHSTKVPENETYLNKLQSITSMFHNPRSGVLKNRNINMLSDVLDSYSIAYIGLGKTLYNIKEYDLAEEYFKKALDIDYEDKVFEAYLNLGNIRMRQNKCDEALSFYKKAQLNYKNKKDNPDIIFAMAVNYRDCFKDQQQADNLFSRYDDLHSKNEEKLQ